MVDKLKLAGLLGASSAIDFRLSMLELTGMLLLMMHWQRGIIDMLVQTGKTKKMTKAESENWERVIKNLETYEEFAWELAPARALIPVMRHFRLTGELPEWFQILNAKDLLGRIPYGNDNLDDIEDILRRVADCRVYEGNNGSTKFAQE